MKLCLVCKEDERLCSCNLSYPKELVDAICKKTGKTYEELLKVDNREKLLLYKNATLVKGRVVFKHSGLVAKYNKLSYPVSFIDFGLMCYGVKYEAEGKPFILAPKEEKQATQERGCVKFFDNDFEEFSIDKKVLGEKVVQDEIISFVRARFEQNDFDKNQLITDLHAFIKEKQQDFTRQTEVDLIKVYFEKEHLHFITAAILLLSYMPEAKKKDKKYAIPIVNAYPKAGFYEKSLGEFLGVLILGQANVYPHTELEELFTDRNIKIGSRSVVDIIAINICNGARTDNLYNEIIKL